MQRDVDGGVVISCDFCGTDWDPYDAEQALPMTEGHHGSVLCLGCLRRAMAEIGPSEAGFTCSLCLRDFAAGVPAWRYTVEGGKRSDAEVPPGRNVGAVLCYDCLRLAAKTFHKDRDVDFRWDPTAFPPRPAGD
ncbi:MAG: hypothetical protein AAF916_07415 [Planctomycetota bacterium]